MQTQRMIWLLATGLLSGCVLAPSDTPREQAALEATAKQYQFQTPATQRHWPDLPAEPTWQQVLERGFLTSGELEAAYHEWHAAMTRIPQVASYPNTNLQVGFEYMFSAERMKNWNRTTISAAFDPTMPLPIPQKVMKAGEVALDQARAAGERFRFAKFDLQRRLLTAYLDLALLQENRLIQQDTISLLEVLTQQASARVATGAPQQDLLKIQTQWRLAKNELASLQAEERRMAAMLNAMLARDPKAPLIAKVPSPRPLNSDDETLIAQATTQNPELAALAREIAGRKNALELARMAYIPNFSPSFSFTGNISQSIGTMVMLPTALPMIRGQIQETQAMLASSEAMLRQTRQERGASFVAHLVVLRNAQRQQELYQQQILPQARQVLESSRNAYAVGQIGFVELIDSQRTLLEVRRVLAQTRIEREKQLAELEALAGRDF